MTKQRRKRARGKKRCAVYVARLAPGEVMTSYAKDCALCNCPVVPSEVHQAGIPIECILVGRNKAMGTDRCLQCGTAWTLRMFRADPSRIVSRVLRRAAA